MILKQSRILIVDDKKEHGERISLALSNAGYPSRFILYDPQMEWNEEKLTGVRAVLFDLALLGSNVVTDNDRAAAQTLLEQVFSETNGPWGLVAWTTHTDEAARLYNYLRDRLPPGIKPVTSGVLNKEDFLQNDEASLAKLVTAVSEKLRPEAPIACLIGWEHSVQKSAASILHQLTGAAHNAPGEKTLQEKLDCLLLRLAEADAGKTLSAHDSLVKPLYSVLTPLLADCLDQIEGDACPVPAGECAEVINDAWSARVNRMLHIDATHNERLVPGALIEIPVAETKITQLGSLGENSAKRQSRIRGLFFRFEDGISKNVRNEISAACKLFIMDITPVCDHAQAKADNENYWRRFVVVCLVPTEYCQHLLKAGHLYAESPLFSEGEKPFKLVVNANLIVSLTKDEVELLPKPCMRVREQLFQHILTWIGRHISRQGLVIVGS